MSPFLLGLVAVIYVVAAVSEAIHGDYFKAGLLVCWGAGNVFLIFLSDT